MNSNLLDPYLDSMNFLNEASLLYTDAVSFGSGRPKEDYFHLDEIVMGVERFSEITGNRLNYFGQYNMTKGIINDCIAKLVKNDENIEISPNDIIVTDGAQEAMIILIETLFSKGDVLVVSDPSYVGFIGFAKIAGIDIRVVKRSDTGVDFDDLNRVLSIIEDENKRVAAMYEVPDFHNPTGISIPLSDRLQLLEIAEKNDFYIIEDNPYGYYRYSDKKIPTMKALDKNRRVIHIGSTSKTVFPSLRIGYLLIDQQTEIDGKMVKLAEMCKKVKSFTTVNTSSLLQAMFGALLYDNDFSLVNYCKEKVEYCKNNRDVLADIITNEFDFCGGWIKPDGGYFTSLKIPFDPTNDMIIDAAKNFGVIVCPMSMFCIDPTNGANTLRLSFSQMTVEQIRSGMGRLKDWIISRN